MGARGAQGPRALGTQGPSYHTLLHDLLSFETRRFSPHRTPCNQPHPRHCTGGRRGGAGYRGEPFFHPRGLHPVLGYPGEAVGGGKTYVQN